HVQEMEENLFKDHLKTHGACQFSGYEHTSGKGTITALVVGGAFVKAMQEGEEGMVLLNNTPFYAEKGGQVGDTGILTNPSAQFIVTDCQSPYGGVTVHVGKLEKGTLTVGESLVATVDLKRRQHIANNHTATHLLHWALQQVLGSHIRQAGSLVEPH